MIWLSSDERRARRLAAAVEQGRRRPYLTFWSPVLMLAGLALLVGWTVRWVGDHGPGGAGGLVSGLVGLFDSGWLVGGLVVLTVVGVVGGLLFKRYVDGY